jgi:hypothetical protein
MAATPSTTPQAKSGGKARVSRDAPLIHPDKPVSSSRQHLVLNEE